jgi:Flp pilus assembly protein TadD
VDLVPNNAGYQEWLGDCLYYLGRYEEARVAIDKALALDPNREGAQRLSTYLEEAGY